MADGTLVLGEVGKGGVGDGVGEWLGRAWISTLQQRRLKTSLTLVAQAIRNTICANRFA